MRADPNAGLPFQCKACGDSLEILLGIYLRVLDDGRLAAGNWDFENGVRPRLHGPQATLAQAYVLQAHCRACMASPSSKQLDALMLYVTKSHDSHEILGIEAHANHVASTPTFEASNERDVRLLLNDRKTPNQEHEESLQ